MALGSSQNSFAPGFSTRNEFQTWAATRRGATVSYRPHTSVVGSSEAASASSQPRSFWERSTRYWIVSWSTAMPSLWAKVSASATTSGSWGERAGV